MHMGFGALIGIIVVALLVGVGVQYFMRSSLRYEWLIVAVAGAFGAFFASETFPGSDVFAGVTDWGFAIDGLYVIPAVIVGVTLAIVADIGVRAGSRQTATA